jgi:hemoglobin
MQPDALSGLSGVEYRYGSESMKNDRSDITGPSDVRILVKAFYEKVRRDDLLGPVFSGAPGFDWESHLPSMYLFWETLLLGAGTYQGQPWPKHATLTIDRSHFERWLSLFIGTVRELFSGPTAQSAENYALGIAETFQRRLGLLPAQADRSGFQEIKLSPGTP